MFDALARIIWLNHTTNNQLNVSKRALDDLERRFGRDRSLFDQPSRFFAASSRADAAVATIREVLEEQTGDRIRLVVWNELHRAGRSTSSMRSRGRGPFGSGVQEIFGNCL